MDTHAAQQITDTFLDTLHGRCRFLAYKQPDTKVAFALVFGEVANRKNVFCRVHSACITAESFLATNCDCREQIQKAFEEAGKNGGVIIYLPQEGRGNGIEAKLKQIELEETDSDLDTIRAFVQSGFPADNRTYEVAAQILQDLNILSIQLYTSSPKKIQELEKFGIVVESRIDFPLAIQHQQALKNIRAKQESLHYFPTPIKEE
jgi:3,4-dihydroxy 2-butanone 4-phosphate synthase/GTP cyclohydrolase II